MNGNHPPSKRRTPTYRRQRRKNGQDLAFVLIGGRRRYLGAYDTPESREQYHRVIAEWMASGGTVPAGPHEITVVEVASKFLKWAVAEELVPPSV